MTTAIELGEARRVHGALREIFGRHVVNDAGVRGDVRGDMRALSRVLALCQAATDAVDDVYCRDKLRLVSEYAAELFSRNEHAKWGRDALSGAEFLRQQVLNALELYASRLYSLETLRASQSREEEKTPLRVPA